MNITEKPCSCNVVTYRTEEDAHGHIIRGWWACTECGKEFVSKPVNKQIPVPFCPAGQEE
jgi:hypothetical protein